VIGLTWTTKSSPAANAHSTSTGSPYSSSIARPTRASSPAWPGDSTAAVRWLAGVSSVRVASRPGNGREHRFFEAVTADEVGVRAGGHVKARRDTEPGAGQAGQRGALAAGHLGPGA
jgi:hypothetical protein